MKALITMIVLGLFSAAIVGCEAKAEVGDPDDNDRTYKKTTTVDADGDRTVKTETKVTRD